MAFAVEPLNRCLVSQTKGKIMRCRVCGCRIRGKLHEEGTHHQQMVKSKSAEKARSKDLSDKLVADSKK